MSVNPALRLCPSLFLVNALRIDSPTSNSANAFDYDSKFYRANPKRRFWIRPAFFDESFDVFESFHDWAQCPRLHVLVIQLATGVHMIVPLWRGETFYKEVMSDSELSMIAIEVSRRQGIDPSVAAKLARIFAGLTASSNAVN